jgi:hypothetical protein
MSALPAGEGDKEDKQGKQLIHETDTDELKRFREKWKRELQPDDVPPSTSSITSTPQNASSKNEPSHLSSTTSLDSRHNIAHSRSTIGENQLITRFLALLELEEHEEHEKPTEDDKQLPSHPPIYILPAELQLTILANLDVKSLEFCSIVCRLWYILARYISTH